MVVTGYFDPLLAQHARRLSEIRETCESLIVVVEDPAEPVLPVEARAELVAALGAVDWVVLPDTTMGVERATFVDEGPAHEALSRWLVDHVQRSHVVIK